MDVRSRKSLGGFFSILCNHFSTDAAVFTVISAPIATVMIPAQVEAATLVHVGNCTEFNIIITIPSIFVRHFVQLHAEAIRSSGHFVFSVRILSL